MLLVHDQHQIVPAHHGAIADTRIRHAPDALTATAHAQIKLVDLDPVPRDAEPASIDGVDRRRQIRPLRRHLQAPSVQAALKGIDIHMPGRIRAGSEH